VVVSFTSFEGKHCASASRALFAGCMALGSKSISDSAVAYLPPLTLSSTVSGKSKSHFLCALLLAGRRSTCFRRESASFLFRETSAPGLPENCSVGCLLPRLPADVDRKEVDNSPRRRTGASEHGLTISADEVTSCSAGAFSATAFWCCAISGSAKMASPAAAVRAQDDSSRVCYVSRWYGESGVEKGELEASRENPGPKGCNSVGVQRYAQIGKP